MIKKAPAFVQTIQFLILTIDKPVDWNTATVIMDTTDTSLTHFGVRAVYHPCAMPISNALAILRNDF